MSQLVIEVNSPEDEALLVQLVDRLQGRVLSKTESVSTNKQNAIDALQRIADRGGATEFGDASEWQRDVRSWDRVLDGREE